MNTTHIERSGAAPVPLTAFEDLQYLKLEQPIGFVWLITLNHHDKRNALCVPLLAELRACSRPPKPATKSGLSCSPAASVSSAPVRILPTWRHAGSQRMRTRCALRAGRR